MKTMKACSLSLFLLSAPVWALPPHQADRGDDDAQSLANEDRPRRPSAPLFENQLAFQNFMINDPMRDLIEKIASQSVDGETTMKQKSRIAAIVGRFIVAAKRGDETPDITKIKSLLRDFLVAPGSPSGSYEVEISEFADRLLALKKAK